MSPYSAIAAALSGLVILTGSARTSAHSLDELREQVRATESAFAASMAERNLEHFSAFVSDEAIFMGGAKPLRGKAEVIAAWKRFFDKPAAPFSWRPERIEILQSGALAASSGPVFDASGRKIAEFSSIWRLDADGQWHIVFDDGHDVCECKKP